MLMVWSMISGFPPLLSISFFVVIVAFFLSRGCVQLGVFGIL